MEAQEVRLFTGYPRVLHAGGCLGGRRVERSVESLAGQPRTYDPAMPTPTGPRPRPANLLSLDYRAEGARLGAPIVPIIDAHAHINGPSAARIYREAREMFGVTVTYSQTRLSQAEEIRKVLGDSVRFVAVPDYYSSDRRHAFTDGYLSDIRAWHALGARMLKFWCAPRGRDFAREAGDANLLALDSPARRRQMDLAASLGMMFMAHIADPDTWFATKYRDASKYGTKLSQYEPLERLGEEYRVNWMLAHMGGWPEDLEFLDGLLSRHSNFYLDTSATKWMVRELSRHPAPALISFLRKWAGRVFFGSDIVTMDEHLTPEKGPRNMAEGAGSPEEAFELYASRYWALRTLFETKYDGPSPIADPDLQMLEPEKYDAMSSPRLRGIGLDKEMLRVLYRDAATAVLERAYGAA